MQKKIITPDDLSAIVNPFSGVKIMTQQKWQAAEPKRNESRWRQLISNFFRPMAAGQLRWDPR